MGVPQSNKLIWLVMSVKVYFCWAGCFYLTQESKEKHSNICIFICEVINNPHPSVVKTQRYLHIIFEYTKCVITLQLNFNHLKVYFLLLLFFYSKNAFPNICPKMDTFFLEAKNFIISPHESFKYYHRQLSVVWLVKRWLLLLESSKGLLFH